jgi:ferredoxin
MEKLAKTIEQIAIKNGADMVGFASAERFNDPALKKIFPEVKTVIAVVFRVLRGSFRGVEEGTTFYQYSTTGVETIEETVMPGALLKICNVIEEAGFLGIPQRKNQSLRKEKTVLNPEMLHTEWYPAGAKELQLDFTKAAVLCGIGEVGLSGALLTERFGPFQRVGLVLTDAELPETEQKPKTLCDNCGECIKACPGNAVDENGIDSNRCAVYFRGANMATNPYMPSDAYGNIENRESVMDGTAEISFEDALKIMDATVFYPPMKHGYVTSICGRACDRACYAHLEGKGVLKSKFHLPLRIRPVWKLPIIK